ncbi:MAG: helix-hairpin-helix domain-containing protein, partial [Candidatus Omnitrophota bacterium]
SIAKQFEWVHSPKFRAPLVIESDSPALYLLKKIRDEAHRFAIRYHRKLKAKVLRRSALDDIPGIGEKRKSILFGHFNSVEEIRHATIEKLQAIPGIGRGAATRIFSFFRSSELKLKPGFKARF